MMQPEIKGGEVSGNKAGMARTTRSALMAFGAAFLLGTLVFLFVKTAGIDFKHDAHWDDDAARIANDFSPAAPRGEFGAMIARILTELERGASKPAFARELAQVRASLGDKESAFRDLRAAHGRSVDAAKAMDEALRNLARQAQTRAEGRVANRPLTGIAALADQLRSDINRRLETFASRAPVMGERVATIHQVATAIDPALGGASSQAESAGRCRFLYMWGSAPVFVHDFLQKTSHCINRWSALWSP